MSVTKQTGSFVASFVALVMCSSSPVAALGPWGIDFPDPGVPPIPPNCAGGFQPGVGLLGCKWFNYDNSFVKANSYTKFETTPEEARGDLNYCIYGSFASVMLWHKWPDFSSFDGYDLYDAKKSIYHTWSYNELKNVACEVNPNTIQLADHGCTPYDYADDEVVRLYIAAHTASHCAGNYNNLLSQANHPRMTWVCRNKLGLPSAFVLGVNATGVIPMIHTAISAGDPVIGLCDGHAFMIDGSEQTGGGTYGYEFHILNFFNSNCNLAENSYIMTALEMLAGVINWIPKSICFPANPVFTVPVGQVATKTFAFGDAYMRKTSNTGRTVQVRIRNVSSSPGGYRIVIKTTDGVVLFDANNYGPGPVTTPLRSYSVGASRVLQVQMYNLAASSQDYKIVLQDKFN